MKKITLLLLLIAGSIQAQNNCAVVCHNGSVLAGVNAQALERHLGHGDTFITNDCDYQETGNECVTLDLPKFDFTKPLPIGKHYYITDLYGRFISVGVVDANFLKNIPKKGVYLIVVDGYRTKKYAK